MNASEETQELKRMQEEESETSSLPPLVAMFPSPGIGHLIPMIEFAKRLTHHHNLPITFIIPTEGPPSSFQTTLLNSLPPPISHIFLPPVTLSDLQPNLKHDTRTSHILLRSLSSLHHTLLSLTTSHHLTALVVDLFGTDAFDIAAKLTLPSYIYFPAAATTLSFALHFPDIYQQFQDNDDLPEPLIIPGCVPLVLYDMPDPVRNRKNNHEAFKWFFHHVNRFKLAEGIIENSFLDLELEAISVLVQKIKPPVYPVGPLVDDGDRTGVENGEECLKWLDEQPRGSVLFVCFGSGGALSSAQMNELAIGLEISEQRFLWVVKSPNDNIANAFYFDEDKNINPFNFLPKGFIERTKGKGLVVPSWAPQAQVLSHDSVGGFLTHCGWNSILESVVNGVPLVAWPLYAEQKLNAALITEEVKVALRPKVNEKNGLVERDEIASVVRKVMEGEEGVLLHDRLKELKVAAARALSENGSSTKQISQLALKWQGNHLNILK